PVVAAQAIILRILRAEEVRLIVRSPLSILRRETQIRVGIGPAVRPGVPVGPRSKPIPQRSARIRLVARRLRPSVHPQSCETSPMRRGCARAPLTRGDRPMWMMSRQRIRRISLGVLVGLAMAGQANAQDQWGVNVALTPSWN